MRTRRLATLVIPAALGLALAAPTSAKAPGRNLDVPFVPTPMNVAETMLRMAKVDRTDTVYDLGSGDGRLVVLAAERYGARAVGFDLDPERVADGRARARRSGVESRAQFVEADLFTVELAPATVVTMYLLPDVNRRLQPRLLSQLRPGTRVVSHNYDLGDWLPDSQHRMGDHTIYLWIVPAQVEGRWLWDLQLPGGARRFSAELDQQYQLVRGMASGTGAAQAAALAGRVDGDRLSFTVLEERNPHPVKMTYRGQVVGGRATGSVNIDNGTVSLDLPWAATLVK